MQASGHIGKLVLVPALAPGGNAAIRLKQPPETALRADGTYLVTGGVSGFGFAAARWLAAHGAGSIALLGRRGADTPGAGDRVSELRALGADVCIYAADVADPASLAAALDNIRRNQPPLRGVIHAASAIADGLATDLDGAAIRDLLRPKLGGAILLDRLTRADPIEMFVLFSSATTLLGAPGQGVYVAANLALEALARRRRAEGLPALAVGWGPIEDAGYLAERPETRDALARRLGAKPMAAAQRPGGAAGDTCQRFAGCRLRRNQLERGAAVPADSRGAAVRRHPRRRSRVVAGQFADGGGLPGLARKKRRRCSKPLSLRKRQASCACRPPRWTRSGRYRSWGWIR